MPSKPVKLSNRFLPAALIVAPILGFVLAGIVIYQTREVETLHREVQVLNSEKTGIAVSAPNTASSTVQADDKTTSTTATIQKPKPDLEGVSTSTRKMLEEAEPFLMGDVRQVIELGPGRIAALFVLHDEAAGWIESAWFVDLDTKEFRKITERIGGECGGIDLITWSEGVEIRTTESPCEAVGRQESLYVNRRGQVVGKITSGNYDRDGRQIEIVRDGKETQVSLVSQDTCEEGSAYFGDYERGYQPPTTTLLGFKVNGQLHSFSAHVVAECQVGYGDSISDPGLSAPSFDGEFVIFHIPGYSISLDGNGRTIYTQEIAYRIPCNYGTSYTTEGDFNPILRLLREDKNGVSQVDENIWDDTTMRPLHTGLHCFESEGISDGRAHFSVTVPGTGINTPAGFVDYNIKTGKFQNLQMIENASSAASVE